MAKQLGSDGTFPHFSFGVLLTVVLIGWLMPETEGQFG